MAVYPKPGRPGTWQVVIHVAGKRYDRTYKGKKAEAEAFEARERVKLEAGEPLDGRHALKFSTFCVDKYRPHAKTHLRPSTWKVRPYQIATLIQTPVAGARTLGELKLTEFRTEHVEAYKDHRTEQKAKPRTVNNELAVWQAVLSYARVLGTPCAKPTFKMLPVIGRGRVTFWTREQLAMLFASIEERAPALLGPVCFLANTGCRKGEALAARKTWVSFKRGRIEIAPNEFWQPKDNEPREIPISDDLRPWVERAMEGPGEWLFPSSRIPKGEELPQRFACWPKLQFDRARKAAGRCDACRRRNPEGLTRCADCAPQLKGGPHTLRHTFASHFLAAVPDLFLLAKLLGHSHERTTKIYAHLLDDHLAKAKNAVSISAGVGPATLKARERWAQGKLFAL